MFINTSKILFESKSQLHRWHKLSLGWCLSIRQRYFLKANHNAGMGGFERCNDVYQYVKDTFWKQITTKLHREKLNDKMFINTSKILFESKSQHQLLLSLLLLRCLSIRQRYFLKANHNDCVMTTSDLLMFINTSKILFESKSQRSAASVFTKPGCLSIRQRYFLKANHNLAEYFLRFP